MTDTPYLILVHGTWDAPAQGSPHWSSLDRDDPANFANILSSLLDQYGTNRTVCRDFGWSGTNSHAARLQAGRSLCDLIISIAADDPSARIHIVAHSHGGNVALKAVELYLRSLRNQAWAILFHLLKEEPSARSASAILTQVLPHCPQDTQNKTPPPVLHWSCPGSVDR